MKIKILIMFFTLTIVFSLCSFCGIEEKKENIYLHNELKGVLFEEKSLAFGVQNKSGSDAFFESGALSDEASGELSGIWEGFVSALPEDVPIESEEILGSVGIAEVISWLSGALGSEENKGALLSFVCIGILFALLELFCEGLGDAEKTARSAIAVILSLPVINLCKGLAFEVSEGIRASSELFSGIIPTLTAILTLGSGTAAASASGAALTASLGFVTGVLSESLLPLSAMTFSASMVSSFDTGGITDGVAKGIRSIFNFLVGITSLLIVGILGVQTVVSVSVDNLALKSAKYAVSGMIPVVGSTVSGALSALIAGVKLLSGTVGSVSVIALLSVVSLPLIRLLFFRFCLFICITVCSFSQGSFGAKLFTSVRGALDTLIATLASSSLVYLLEIIIVTASIRGAL